MQQTMLISAAILLAGVLIGTFIAQPSLQPWRGNMMHNDNDSPTIQEAPIANGTRGPGMMQGAMFATSEREFIENMVPHHEEAITTAHEVLDRGATTPGMEELANAIINSQTEEVALMKQSYEEWFKEPYRADETYDPMMRDLAPYSGVTLDRIFLHDMTMHHMGAIMMSRSVQPYLEHEVMQQLTKDIIVNQSREIKTMQELFVQLDSQ